MATSRILALRKLRAELDADGLEAHERQTEAELLAEVEASAVVVNAARVSRRVPPVDVAARLAELMAE